MGMMMRRDAEAELNLPPGFRFHPTDEELVVHYLCPKVAKQCLRVPIIAEVDLYKYNPWDLPGTSYSQAINQTLGLRVRALEFLNHCDIEFFLGWSREGAVWAEGVVLLHAEGPQVPEREQAEQGGWPRVLEGDGGR